MTVDGVNGGIKSKTKQLDRIYLLSQGIPCLTHAFSKRVVWDGEKERELTKEEYSGFMGFKEGEINLGDLTLGQVSGLMGNGWDINLVSKIFERMFGSLKA